MFRIILRHPYFICADNLPDGYNRKLTKIHLYGSPENFQEVSDMGGNTFIIKNPLNDTGNPSYYGASVFQNVINNNVQHTNLQSVKIFTIKTVSAIVITVNKAKSF